MTTKAPCGCFLPPCRRPALGVSRNAEIPAGTGRPELAGELYESALSAATNFSLQCDSTYLVDTGNLRNQPIACLKGFQSINVFAETMPQWVAEYFPVHLGKPTS